MAAKTNRHDRERAQSEIGTIRKSWRGRLKIALVYPNRYHVGMSNLGFQTLYRLFNSYDHIVCERAFLPEDDQLQKGRLRTFESEKPLGDVDIIAFSISFENDYPHILTILDLAGIALQSNHREEKAPLVIAGGVASFLNPEPLSAFVDCFLIGEAESILPDFIEVFETGAAKLSHLEYIAQKVPGAYVPAFYRPEYGADGTLSAFQPITDVPPKIKRAFTRDLSDVSTHTAVITPPYHI